MWASVFALAAIFITSVFYVGHQQQNTAEITAHLQEVAYNPEDQDKQEAIKKIYHVIEIWEDNLDGWTLLFGKDAVDPITISLQKLPYMYQLEMYDELVLETQEVIVHIQNIWVYQKVTLRGIY